MAISALDMMRMAQMTEKEFRYEYLSMPPWTNFLSTLDEEYLTRIATSKKLAGNPEKRLKLIDSVMKNRGFKYLAGGTNRVVYRHLEDTSFVAKVAIDKTGMSDNPAEFRVQHFIKPYCAKMFQVSPNGTIGFSERVIPIRTREEFVEIADDVFDMLVYAILGKYVLEDIGTDYFANYGVRPSFGPVLLDYPYVFELDGRKLICTDINPRTKHVCRGEIGYDDGINYLYCHKCGKRYDAFQLQSYKKDNKIIVQRGGTIPMKVSIVKGDKEILTAYESEIIANVKKPTREAKPGDPIVKVVKGDKVICDPQDAIIEEEESNVINLQIPTPEVAVEEDEPEATPVEEEVESVDESKDEQPVVEAAKPKTAKASSSKSEAKSRKVVEVKSNSKKTKTNTVEIDSKFIPAEDKGEY